jgi:hypothetical protein
VPPARSAKIVTVGASTSAMLGMMAAFAAIHAGLAGTDTVNRLYQALTLLLTMVAVAATVIRILAPGRVRPAPS